ncbi:MAG: NUDIX domain-containing protein [Candidatus Omnitrophota bacterium]
MRKKLTVVAALIKQGDRVLICQRKENDAFACLWEFPGGTVEQNETFKEAVKREISEELDVAITPKKMISIFEDSNQYLKIKVHLFECKINKGKLKALDCKDFIFVNRDEISAYNLAPVDKKIAGYLIENGYLY